MVVYYKNKDYKMTAVVDLSGLFQFVSPAVPAMRHDIERLLELQEKFESGIDKRDVIVTDRGYQGFEKRSSHRKLDR
jgi:hypothetical protein